MSADTEGYVTRRRDGQWVICDRFSVQVDEEPPHTSYSAALRRCGVLNDAVNAARFA